MKVIEVEFEHQVYVMTELMDVEDLVLCVISAEVTPMDAIGMGPNGMGGQVQILNIRVIDDRFPGLDVNEGDLTNDEYDKIEDRAYYLAENSQEDYGGYWH
tara:strand:- start:310 stop:612 length:303 start_codon:yes stop_codon:yes gene_type:complete